MLIPRAFAVLGATVLAVVMNEILSWILVYRTDKYTRLKQNLLQAEKRLEVRSKTELPLFWGTAHSRFCTLRSPSAQCQ